MVARDARSCDGAQVDRERTRLGPVGRRRHVALARRDLDPLVATVECIVLVARQPRVRSAVGAPCPQLDGLSATLPRPFHRERIGDGQPGVQTRRWLVYAPAHADRSHTVADRAQLRPLAADRDAVRTRTIERDLPPLRRGVDPTSGRALLGSDVANERPELERGAQRERRVAEPACDSRRPPRLELAA